MTELLSPYSRVLLALFGVTLSLWVLSLAYVARSQNLAVLENRQRIAVLHEQVTDLRRDLDQVKVHGSQITDRRLAVLEYKAGVKTP